MAIADAAADAVPLPESRTLDTILSAHKAALGGDFDGYRNHAYRVANFCVAQSSRDPEQVEKIAITAAFHDLGIWTAGTFDYLQPSVNVAREYLSRSDERPGCPRSRRCLRRTTRFPNIGEMPGGSSNHFVARTG